MNLNWKMKKKKFIIMIIREAPQSVIQIKLVNFLIYFILLAVSFIVLYTLILSYLHTNTQLKVFTLKNDLDSASQKLEDVTTSKTLMIDQLQNQIIQLSDQAELMKSKMEEIIKREEYLKSIVLNNKAIDPAKLSPISLDFTSQYKRFSIGGAPVTVSTEEIFTLSENTNEILNKISNQIDDLNEDMNKVITEAETKARLLRISPSIWPTNSRYITSGYGYRIDPFNKKPSFHTGIDFGGDINDPVYTTADGVVIFTGSDLTHGRNVIVEHSKGMKTRYLHLNKIMVKKGDKVTKGQVIGGLGSTGRSTGPHLHYEVIKNGVSVNPLPYLKTSKGAK
jgi:murein DD-endopeptidase MepM/ murein hydrolase activator NlpD